MEFLQTGTRFRTGPLIDMTISTVFALRPFRRPARRIVAGSALGLIATLATAEPNRVTLPDISTLEPYTSIVRGPVTETARTTREALEAVAAGRPIPNGTSIVLSFVKDGQLKRHFVMQKGADWGLDYPEDQRAGDWQFQWFRADGSIKPKVNTAECSACHRQRRGREHLYTFHELREFD